MNIEKRILAAVLVLALVAVTITKQIVLANEPNTFEASTLDELTTAIENASDGDTIIITARIELNGEQVIGDDSKHLTIKRNTLEYAFMPCQADCTFKNLTFDGEEQSAPPFFYMYQGSVVFNSCTFQNHGSDAESQSLLTIAAGSARLNGCTFRNNKANNGGCISTDPGTTAILTNCIITGCHAFRKGGAIFNKGDTILNDSLIYGNTADEAGNDIYTTGQFLRNTDLETMAAILDDDTKIIEGWKDEAADEIIEPTTGIETEKALTLVLSDAPVVDPEPGTNEPGTDAPDDNTGGQNDGQNDSGEQSNTDNTTGGETGTGDATETGSGNEQQTDTPTNTPTDAGQGSGTSTATETPSTTTGSSTAVTPSDTGGSSASGNNSTPTQSTTPPATNTTTDARSTTTDNRTTSDDHSTTNTDRSSSDRTTITNNYYQDKTKDTTKDTTGEQKGTESTQGVQKAPNNSPVGSVQASQSTPAINEALGYTVSGSYKADRMTSDGQAVKSLDDAETVTESPTDSQTGATHFDIDLTDANFSIKANDQGGYDIVVRDATTPPAADAEPTTEPQQKKGSIFESVSFMDALQIILLGAIFLTMYQDKRKPKTA